MDSEHNIEPHGDIETFVAQRTETLARANRDLLDEIAARKHQESIIAAQLRLSAFAIDHSVNEVLQAFLDEAEKLTGSAIGFYHFVEEDQVTLRLQSWSTNTLARMCSAEASESHYPIDKAGVWVDCVRQGKPVIHNDYASLAHKKGLPDGHAPIARELVVPVYRADQIVAILGVGNKETDYVDEDVKTVAELANTCWDIVARKRAEEALRDSEEKFRTFVEGTDDLIVRIDRDGEFSYVNQVSQAVFGLPPEECVGLSALAFVHEDDLIRTQTALARWVEAGTRSAKFENRQISRSGDVHDMLWTFNMHYDDNGELMAVNGIASDITERKKNEEQRLILQHQVQHAQKLESLGVLAGGIAHDFNNLLMSILGNADLAMETLDLQASARGNIAEIMKASRRAADLARQMLAYSGKGKFVIEPIRLDELVREMGHLLEVSISKKAIIRYNFTEDLPPTDCDGTQIRQVIMNLITNASEAIADKSGVISLSTGVMDCDRAYLDNMNATVRAGLPEPLSPGRYVFIEVADTGCGMDAETIERIFDPFFTTKFTGRGLGMAAVLGIVHGHNGAVQIYSEPGSGTTFKVLFPVSKSLENAAEPQGQAADQDQPWRGQGTILIADDEESVCNVGRQMLTRMGFEVLTASDGREAVDTFRDHADEIVCILLDLTMPHLDGEQAFGELRRIRPDVRVILCSGYNEQDATQRFLGKGLAGFIQKPYNMTELREKLTGLMPGDEA